MPRSTGRAAVTTIFAGPDLRSGTVCLPISPVTLTRSPSVRGARPGRVALRKIGVCLPFCSSTIWSCDSAAPGAVTRPRAAWSTPDELRRLGNRDRRSGHPAGDEYAPPAATAANRISKKSPDEKAHGGMITANRDDVRLNGKALGASPGIPTGRGRLNIDPWRSGC